MNTMAKTTGASKTFLITSSSLALQNVYIQLCTLPLRLELGCGALIGGFGPDVKLYFDTLVKSRHTGENRVSSFL